MAKKVEKQTKKAQTKKANEEGSATQSKQKQTKAVEQSNELELLPSSLQARFQEFNGLYQDINKSIAGTGKSDSFDVTKKQAELVERIEEAITNVFKDQLQSAEKEIQTAQEDIQKQITSLEGSYEQVRTILAETGAFSAEEITATLATLEAKVNDKKAALEVHQKLLEQSRNAYAWS